MNRYAVHALAPDYFLTPRMWESGVSRMPLTKELKRGDHLFIVTKCQARVGVDRRRKAYGRYYVAKGAPWYLLVKLNVKTREITELSQHEFETDARRALKSATLT